MKIRVFGLVLVVVLLAVVGGAVATSASSGKVSEPDMVQAVPVSGRVTAGGPIIIDHTCTDLSKVPDYWIKEAKKKLRLSYGHTSHGSQLVTGMAILRADPATGNLYDYNTNGAVVSGTLSLDDWTPSGDLGNPDRVTWASRTRDYLNGPGSDRNVVIWSWCGQVNSASETDIETYLTLMNELEQDFPDVTFVYMTGHLEGTGLGENLYARNNQIRDYCQANNKILFDFADIESWDPDGNFYPDEDDVCGWCSTWCSTHSCPACLSDCAHSHCFNCYNKGKAMWWMLARIAGWPGPEGTEQPDLGPSYKVASTGMAERGERITYTVVISSAGGPMTHTVSLADEVPAGLAYVSGTLTSTIGMVSDTAAPTLGWSDVLSPTPVVTITYAVTVTAATSQVITNYAMIAVPGYEAITRTAAVTVVHDPGWPNFAPSYKAPSVSSVKVGELVTYTVVIHNLAGPMTNTVQFSDTIRDGLVYVSGTITATTGMVSDILSPTLRWIGVLTPTPAVTISYAVQVVATETRFITNVAEFLMEPGYWGDPPIATRNTLQARILVNGYGAYLPLIVKSYP